MILVFTLTYCEIAQGQSRKHLQSNHPPPIS